MKKLSKFLGLGSLLAIAIAPFVFFFDQISFSVMTGILFGATLVWYVTAFLWIGKPSVADNRASI